MLGWICIILDKSTFMYTILDKNGDICVPLCIDLNELRYDFFF